MLTLALAVALNASPVLVPALDETERYGDLASPQLIEKRRLLLEERPSFGVPITLAVLGLLPIAGGGTVAGLAVAEKFGNAQSSMIAGATVGGVLILVGAAMIVVGVKWLLDRMDLRNKINLRVDEIDQLLELKNHAGLPSSVGPLAIRF
ncbi:MAG: hypothetical protein QM723_26990 [Myxococcaceae bacterium]